jgi:hypothetical protein
VLEVAVVRIRLARICLKPQVSGPQLRVSCCHESQSTYIFVSLYFFIVLYVRSSNEHISAYQVNDRVLFDIIVSVISYSIFLLPHNVNEVED